MDLEFHHGGSTTVANLPAIPRVGDLITLIPKEDGSEEHWRVREVRWKLDIKRTERGLNLGALVRNTAEVILAPAPANEIWFH